MEGGSLQIYILLLYVPKEWEFFYNVELLVL